MPQRPEAPSGCKMASLLETLTKPWTLHILWTLSSTGPMRFGALRRSITGISARLLTERLRGLEEKGFVFRQQKPSVPPEVTYGITNRMKDIELVFADLHALVEKWELQDAPVKAKKAA